MSGLQVSGEGLGGQSVGCQRRPCLRPACVCFLTCFLLLTLCQILRGCLAAQTSVCETPKGLWSPMDSLLSKASSGVRVPPWRFPAPLCPCRTPGLPSPCPCSWPASEVGLHLGNLDDGEWMEAGYFLTLLYKLFIDGLLIPSLCGHAAGGGLVLSNTEGGPAL